MCLFLDASFTFEFFSLSIRLPSFFQETNSLLPERSASVCDPVHEANSATNKSIANVDNCNLFILLEIRVNIRKFFILRLLRFIIEPPKHKKVYRLPFDLAIIYINNLKQSHIDHLDLHSALLV